MAGHSQFANIKHRKGAQDKKKAKLFTKILREISVAAKTGQVDPDFNPRLRNAIIEARVNNMPKDRIEAAIKKAAQGVDSENYEEIRYEGYAAGGIALIVEAMTDNRNRTAGEVRSIFTKGGGTLGESGSVVFMFDHIALIQYDKKITAEENMFEAAIDAGAEDMQSSIDFYFIITSIENFIQVRDKLIEKFGDPISAKIVWKARDSIEITDLEQAQKLLKLIDTLEDCDDVQNVCGNHLFMQEIVDKL